MFNSKENFSSALINIGINSRSIGIIVPSFGTPCEIKPLSALSNNSKFNNDSPSLFDIIAPIIDEIFSSCGISVESNLLSDLSIEAEEKPFKIFLYITLPLFVKLRSSLFSSSLTSICPLLIKLSTK